MTYGFRATNESSYVQIDSESPRLCMIEKGSYGGSNYTVTVMFSIPITTTEPPMVFIRPSVNNGNELYRTMILLGSSGAWTGFQITAMNIAYQPTGAWFVATFASRGTALYGMRLWDPASKIIYDSGAYAVAVTNVLPGWTYAGQVQVDIGRRYKWVAGRGLAENEYFMINVFSLGIQDNGSGSTCAVSIDYTNNQTCMWSSGFTAWIDQGHRPVVFAKLVV
ncbi:hypothetical protein OH708_08065 [Pseudomonas capsici]|uniref:hypothetical protein n=1 Tax=Pseudomonas capsici TaxID=2810614 RepID=UPI0021F1B03E|nr:hypothetical protein [Pseudomonas capsici]MCV4287856.1 hypothetical protein [Pseudomonas capsici]